VEQIVDMIDASPTCPCGNGVLFWSGLLEQGFCSEECYDDAKVKALVSV
jgi:hypothetical protein